MISEVPGHVRYKGDWLLTFAVDEFLMLTKDNRHAIRSWLGHPDHITKEGREHWTIKHDFLGDICVVSGPDGTTYNLKWNHWNSRANICPKTGHSWGANYLRSFNNKGWLFFFRQTLKNLKG